jgi:hypothetical protein
MRGGPAITFGRHGPELCSEARRASGAAAIGHSGARPGSGGAAASYARAPRPRGQRSGPAATSHAPIRDQAPAALASHASICDQAPAVPRATRRSAIRLRLCRWTTLHLRLRSAAVTIALRAVMPPLRSATHPGLYFRWGGGPRSQGGLWTTLCTTLWVSCAHNILRLRRVTQGPL